jgi:hypothetical protein
VPRTPNAAARKTAVSSWPGRWKREQPPPSCAALLAPPESAACETAARALATLQRAVDGPDTTWIAPAADLALAAQRATDHLRRKGFSELLSTRENTTPDASAPRTSESAGGASRPRSGSAAPKPSNAAEDHAGHDHHPSRKHDNPTLAGILSYSRLSSLALRQLGVHLEHGEPLERRRALDALRRLSVEQPRWSALESLVKEAELLETDPGVRSELAALAAQLRKNRNRR